MSNWSFTRVTWCTVTDGRRWTPNPRDVCSADRFADLHSEELTIILGLRAKRISVFIRYIGTIGGCGPQGFC